MICGPFGNVAPYDAVEVLVITPMFYIIYTTDKFGSAPQGLGEKLFS
jgi:hypothetical protein